MTGAKLTEKLELYGHKVPGIKAYTKIWLPFILVTAVWGVITTDLLVLPFYDIALRAGYLSLSIVCVITIRTPDKLAYRANLALLSYIVIKRLYQTALFFYRFESISRDRYLLLEPGLFLVGPIYMFINFMVDVIDILKFFITLSFCISYIKIFVVHRKFFLTPVQELWDDN